MDPLSLTASVIAVLQAAEAVISICCDYRAGVKNASWEVPRVLDQLRSLRSILRKLEELSDRAETKSLNNQLPTLKDLCDPKHGTLVACRKELESLKAKLTPPDWAGRIGSKKNSWFQALTWPLKKADTEKTVSVLKDYESALNLAVTADQTSLIMDIHESGQKATISAYRQSIFRWLDSPDPSSRYNRGLSLRHEGTGIWFTKSQAFENWLQEPHSTIWLSGFVGNGKTVLSSTIIEHTIRHASTLRSAVVAYFYFAFDDPRSQSNDALIRSIITQLAASSAEPVSSLESLYRTCLEGQRQPTHDKLFLVLRELLESFDDTYIICDALDECRNRDECLRDIRKMISWGSNQSHLLFTSRREHDIEDSLTPVISLEAQLRMEVTSVNEDIKAYVEHRLQTERKLKKWQSLHLQQKIITALLNKADGMFQWVVCQLDTIEHCINEDELERTLQDLPRGLDDTYDRILRKIDDAGRHATVYRILQFLIYCDETLTIETLAETVALNVETQPYIDPRKRLLQVEDLLSMCSGLITEHYNPKWGVLYQPMGLAHFSIQEYLLSQRIKEGFARNWYIDRYYSNTFMTQAYLKYILHVGDMISDSNITHQLSKDYPLADTAVSGLMKYARRMEEATLNRDSAILELFLNTGNSFLAWLALTKEDQRQVEEFLHSPQDQTGVWSGTLHIAAEHGLCGTVKHMLDLGVDVDSRSKLGDLPWDFDDQGAYKQSGFGHTALMQASYHCRPETVQLLLERGADVNAGGGILGNALATAVIGPFDGWVDMYGDAKVVQLLLDHGADANLNYGRRGGVTLLQEAIGAYSTRESKIEVVELLIDYGADINATSPFGSVLEIATRRDRQTIALKLINMRVSLKDNIGINSLVWASRSQLSKDTILALIASGVNLNARASEDSYMNGCALSTPLESACDAGAWRAVAILLDKGADPNLRSDDSANALERALCSTPIYGDDYDDGETLKLLLSHGTAESGVRDRMLSDEGRQKYRELLTSSSVEAFVRDYKGINLDRYKPSPEELSRSKVLTSMDLPFFLG